MPVGNKNLIEVKEVTNDQDISPIDLVILLLKQGLEITAIEDELENLGYSKDDANKIVNTAFKLFKEREQASAIFQYIIDLLLLGTNTDEIVEKLQEMGFKKDTALELVNNVIIDLQKEKEVENGFNYVIDLFSDGMRESEIIVLLVEKGLDKESAKNLTNHIKEKMISENQFLETEEIIRDLLLEGKSENEVIESLVDQGYYKNKVISFVNTVREELQSEALREAILQFTKEKLLEGKSKVEILKLLEGHGMVPIQAKTIYDIAMREFQREREATKTIEEVRHLLKKEKPVDQIIKYLVDNFDFDIEEADELVTHVTNIELKLNEKKEVIKIVMDLLLRGYDTEYIEEKLQKLEIAEDMQLQFIETAKDRLIRQSIAEKVMMRIRNKFHSGSTADEIIEDFVNRGADPEISTEVVSKVFLTENNKKASKKIMSYIVESLKDGKSTVAIMKFLDEVGIPSKHLSGVLEYTSKSMRADYEIIRLVELRKGGLDEDKLKSLIKTFKSLGQPIQVGIILEHMKKAKQQEEKDILMKGVTRLKEEFKTDKEVLQKLNNLGISEDMSKEILLEIKKKENTKEKQKVNVPTIKSQQSLSELVEVLRSYNMPYQSQEFEKIKILKETAPLMASRDNKPSIYQVIKKILASGQSIDYAVNFLVARGFAREQAREIVRYAMLLQ